ncbi:MAG: hypothetical protein NXI31_11435 [bacterium]|nr:hypothetical protein [bacterium]
MPSEANPPFINRQTLIPIGLLVAVVMSAIAGTWKIASALGDFQEDLAKRDANQALRFQRIELKIESLEGAIQNDTKNDWAFQDMRAWVEVLAARNQSMSVPKVEKVR